MPRFVNDHYGIVLFVRNDTMEIMLPRGGTRVIEKKEGVQPGDRIALVLDALDKVVEILPKEEADEIVERGSNHIFDSASREPPEIEEDDEYGDNIQIQDESILWCPEL